MNKKEISELSRRWKPEKCAVSKIYGCYVSVADKRIVADLNESLGRMPQDEAERYLGLLKKVLSGSQGRNLVDIVFTTEQVAGSDEHRLLMDLKNTTLQDSDARQAFYRKVIDCLDMGEEDYLILLASDSYDVPHRGKDDSIQHDASDEVFTYFLCAVCPVKESKGSLGYFPGDNEFHCAGNRTVAPPELGFLFPCFDDRAANIYNALFYARKPDQLHQEFIDGVFHTEAPLSSADQRENFNAALIDSLGDQCSFEVVQAVQEQLAERISRHKEEKNPEPLTLTAKEVGQMLRQSGVKEEQTAAFETQCAATLGEGAALNPANLMGTGKFEVKTAEATVTVDPACSYVVETRMIDGKPYVLIPAGADLEVNGIPVRVSAETEK